MFTKHPYLLYRNIAVIIVAVSGFAALVTAATPEILGLRTGQAGQSNHPLAHGQTNNQDASITKVSEGRAAPENRAVETETASTRAQSTPKSELQEQTVASNATPDLTAKPGVQSNPGSKTEPSQPKPAEAASKPVSKPVRPTLKAHINLTNQVMTVSSGGNVLHTWKISSGRRGYETPTGTYKPTWMARRWYSRQYRGAPMPYSVFFNGGIATHGTRAVRRLGRPASHGCIRLKTGNARKFYNLVRRHGKSRTRIVVTGHAKQRTYRKRRVAHRNSNRVASRNSRRKKARYTQRYYKRKPIHERTYFREAFSQSQ